MTAAPVYCTKTASRLIRTYTDRHGLKDLTKELIGVDLSKAQQSSDWGAGKLSEEQVSYAASDVLHLHALRARLDEMLLRERRDSAALGVPSTNRRRTAGLASRRYSMAAWVDV